MSANIAAIQALFPPRDSATAVWAGSAPATIRGACPYDAIMRTSLGAFPPLFIGVIETVRADPKWGPIYRGDLTHYSGDHSAADLGLCGEFARLGLGGPMIDTAIRTSDLYRPKWERDDYRASTISKAVGGTQTQHTKVRAVGLLTPENGLIDAGTVAPPLRDWVIDGVLLSGKSAVMAGLSGVSKTQLALQMSMHVAAGIPFAGRSTKSGKVLFLSGEEDRGELLRRVNAAIRHGRLPAATIRLIRDNLFAFPLVGEDIRLTAQKGGALAEAEFAKLIIEAAKAQGGVQLIVLDHAGLIHGGDFNAKEDAALTMRVINHITHATGAAVVLLAHSPKSAMRDQGADASMVFGSAAFVEQSRGGWVLMPMSEKQAKSFQISEADRPRYVALTGVKANYTPVGQEFWFRRVSFDEVGVLDHTPLVASQPQAKTTASLVATILTTVGQSPGRYSKTGLRDQFHGKKEGPWKASKDDIVRNVDDLLQSGKLLNRPPTAGECKRYGHGPQVKHVLDVTPQAGAVAS